MSRRARAQRPSHDANRRQSEPFAQHARGDVARQGAERHADADFPAPFADDERQHAVETDRGQNHGDRAEGREQRDAEPAPASDRARNSSIVSVAPTG